MGLGKSQRLVTAALFCAALAVMFALHATDALDAAKSAYSTGRAGEVAAMAPQFESAYNARYADEHVWVNLYGLANRVLEKREAANYQVVRGFDDSLYAQETGWFAKAAADGDEPDVAACVAALRDVVEEGGGMFLFVQCPYKTADDAPELADYVRPGTNARFDAIVGLLGDVGVPCLDLREVETCREWYRTDHHWTCEAAFAAAGEVVAELAHQPGLEALAGSVPLLENDAYDRVEYRDSLLGSAGVKVGEWYVGKDDLIYLAPTFATDLEYRHYIDGNESARFQGGFEEAFIDSALLDNPGYYNKYNAFLHGGYVESVITNRMAPNDLKLLFISHSYGRPMAQYLSLAFAETRYLDPQEGRFSGDCADYVAEYRPDAVVVMYDGMLNVG